MITVTASADNTHRHLTVNRPGNGARLSAILPHTDSKSPDLGTNSLQEAIMISLDNLSIVLALSSIGLSLHVLRAVWQLWRSGGVR